MKTLNDLNKLVISTYNSGDLFKEIKDHKQIMVKQTSLDNSINSAGFAGRLTTKVGHYKIPTALVSLLEPVIKEGKDLNDIFALLGKPKQTLINRYSFVPFYEGQQNVKTSAGEDVTRDGQVFYKDTVFAAVGSSNVWGTVVVNENGKNIFIEGDNTVVANAAPEAVLGM